MSTAQDLITSAKHFEASNVEYKPAKVDSRGGKRVQFKLNGNPLVLSIPLMFTWGINERVDESSGRISYDVSIVFEEDKSKSIRDFCGKLKDLENKILDDAAGPKAKEWFGKAKQSREVAEAMMYPILKYPKDKQTGEPDKNRDPNLKLKVPYWEGNFNVELYNMEGSPVFLPPKEGQEMPQGDKTPIDFVPSKSYIKGLIACDGIWMAGGRFGVTWKLLQAQVKPPVNLTGTGVCHILADDDDDELLGKIDDGAKETKEDVTEQTVNFSDGEDDDKSDEEPAPKPKKKVVKRKKTTAAAT